MAARKLIGGLMSDGRRVSTKQRDTLRISRNGILFIARGENVPPRVDGR